MNIETPIWMKGYVERLRRYLDQHTATQPWLLDRIALVRVALLAGIAAVASLTLLALGGYHAGFETLNRSGAAWPPVLLQSVNYLGDSLCVLAGFLVFAGHRRDLLWTGVVTAIVATVISRGLKSLFNSARPPAVIDSAQIFVSGPVLTSHSFPSGHTVSIFVAAGMLLFFGKTWRWRLVALALASLVGASRVMAGAHWPIDVLAGATIGLASTSLGAAAAIRLQGFASMPGQVFQVLLLGACAVALIAQRPEFPLARPEGIAIGVAGLIALCWIFVVAPSRTD